MLSLYITQLRHVHEPFQVGQEDFHGRGPLRSLRIAARGVVDALAADVHANYIVQRSLLRSLSGLAAHDFVGLLLDLREAIQQVLERLVESFQRRAGHAIVQRLLDGLLLVALQLGLVLELDRGQGATQIDLVLLEFIAETVRYDSHEVRGLTNCGIDLVPRHVDVVLNSTETEAADGAEFIQRRNMEHFVNEVRLAQLRVQLIKVRVLTVDLLLALKLLGQLVLVVVNFLPDGAILLEDVLFLALLLGEHGFLFLLDFFEAG